MDKRNFISEASERTGKNSVGSAQANQLAAPHTMLVFLWNPTGGGVGAGEWTPWAPSGKQGAEATDARQCLERFVAVKYFFATTFPFFLTLLHQFLAFLAAVGSVKETDIFLGRLWGKCFT